MWDSLNERGLLGTALPPIDRPVFVAHRASLLVKCLGASASDVAPPKGFLLFEPREGGLRVRVSAFHDRALLDDLSLRLAPYAF